MGLIHYKQTLNGKNIYLSISKQTSKASIDKVLAYLDCLNEDIYMYNGEKYTISDLHYMDILLVLPPDNTGEETDEGLIGYNIGRGQYSEIEYFYKKNMEDNVYIISDIEHGLHIDEFHSLNFCDTDDWSNWGVACTRGQCININNYDFQFADHDKYERLSQGDDYQPAVDSVSPSSNPRIHLALTRKFI